MSKEPRENAKCQQPRANSRIVKHSSPEDTHAMKMPVCSRDVEYSVVKERTRMLGCLLGSIFGTNIFLPSAWALTNPCQTGISHQKKSFLLYYFSSPPINDINGHLSASEPLPSRPLRSLLGFVCRLSLGLSAVSPWGLSAVSPWVCLPSLAYSALKSQRWSGWDSHAYGSQWHSERARQTAQAACAT